MIKITQVYKDINFKKVFEYEQGIVTGVKKTGDPLSYS